MESATEKIGAESFMDQLTALACELGVKIYLTGGGLRDTLLGRTIKDLDFAVTALPEKLPVLFARRIGGTFFLARYGKAQSRVCQTDRRGAPHIRFCASAWCGYRGGPVPARFYYQCHGVRPGDGQSLIDPLNGEEDLRNKTIRRCSTASFADDPLRLLRAVRLSAQLGFAIEVETLHDDAGKAPSLEKMAAERKRDELLKILESPGLEKSLTLLRDTGLLAVVIPGERESGVDESAIKNRYVLRHVSKRPCRSSRLFSPTCITGLQLMLGRGIEGDITALTMVNLSPFIAHGTGSADALGGETQAGKQGERAC